MPSIRTKRFAVVNFATAALQPLVAADANNKIKVTAFFLVAAGAVVVTFQSGANPITGPMNMIAGTPLSMDTGDEFGHLFETALNQALNLNMGAAVQVSGFIAYVLERQ